MSEIVICVHNLNLLFSFGKFSPSLVQLSTFDSREKKTENNFEEEKTFFVIHLRSNKKIINFEKAEKAAEIYDKYELETTFMPFIMLIAVRGTVYLLNFV